MKRISFLLLAVVTVFCASIVLEPSADLCGFPSKRLLGGGCHVVQKYRLT